MHINQLICLSILEDTKIKNFIDTSISLGESPFSWTNSYIRVDLNKYEFIQNLLDTFYLDRHELLFIHLKEWILNICKNKKIKVNSNIRIKFYWQSFLIKEINLK